MIESFYERMYRINSNQFYSSKDITRKKIHETFGAVLKSYKKSYPRILDDKNIKRIVRTYKEICEETQKNKKGHMNINEQKKQLNELVTYLNHHYRWCFPEFHS